MPDSNKNPSSVSVLSNILSQLKLNIFWNIVNIKKIKCLFTLNTRLLLCSEKFLSTDKILCWTKYLKKDPNQLNNNIWNLFRPLFFFYLFSLDKKVFLSPSLVASNKEIIKKVNFQIISKLPTTHHAKPLSILQ